MIKSTTTYINEQHRKTNHNLRERLYIGSVKFDTSLVIDKM